MTLTPEQVREGERSSLSQLVAKCEPEYLRWLEEHVGPRVAATFQWERKQTIGGLSDPYIDAILKAGISPYVYWSQDQRRSQSRDADTARVSLAVASSSPRAAPGTTSQPTREQHDYVKGQNWWEDLMHEFDITVHWNVDKTRVSSIEPNSHLGDEWKRLAHKLGRDWEWASGAGDWGQGAFITRAGVVPQLYGKKGG